MGSTLWLLLAVGGLAFGGYRLRKSPRLRARLRTRLRTTPFGRRLLLLEARYIGLESGDGDDESGEMLPLPRPKPKPKAKAKAEKKAKKKGKRAMRALKEDASDDGEEEEARQEMLEYAAAAPAELHELDGIARAAANDAYLDADIEPPLAPHAETFSSIGRQPAAAARLTIEAAARDGGDVDVDESVELGGLRDLKALQSLVNEICRRHRVDTRGGLKMQYVNDRGELATVGKSARIEDLRRATELRLMPKGGANGASRRI